jgi:DNA-binding response OmpR family regulator
VAHARGRRQAATAAPEFASLNEYKVLVADNDPTILDAMQALLEQWGARVFRAQNSSEALWLAGCKDLDAVLVDYHLGEAIDGLDLIQRIAEIRRGGCAAALLTADHGVELTLAARRAGVRLLRKPLRPAALRALLSAFKLRSTRGSAA